MPLTSLFRAASCTRFSSSSPPGSGSSASASGVLGATRTRNSGPDSCQKKDIGSRVEPRCQNHANHHANHKRFALCRLKNTLCQAPRPDRRLRRLQSCSSQARAHTQSPPPSIFPFRAPFGGENRVSVCCAADVWPWPRPSPSSPSWACKAPHTRRSSSRSRPAALSPASFSTPNGFKWLKKASKSPLEPQL